jgi:chemotaxis protein MotB
VKKVTAGHHGGAWKVAYADFVTAMMAFFLLMWLLNATSEEQRKGIADYFDPTLPISRTSAGGVGMLSGDSIFAEDRLAGTLDQDSKRRPDNTRGTDTAPGGTDPSEHGEAEVAEAALEAELASAMQDPETEGLSEHFHLRVTPEGLVIEIVDLSDTPLFEAGSARPGAVLRTLLGILVPLLSTTTNDIAIVGHTDARPFQPGATYTNWELSAERAGAARRLAIDLGLEARRVVRVSGVADTNPFDPDPASPRNRRIAVVLLREGRR